MPVLTRVYGPESFGTLAVYTALASQLMPLLTLRYSVALPLPRSDGSALNLMAMSLGLLAVLTLTCLAVLSLASGPLLDWLQAGAVKPWWWLIPLGAAAMALFELMSFWATRLRGYGLIARAQMLQALLGESTKVGLGLAGLHPLGLVLGQIIAQGAGAATFLRHYHADWDARRRQVSGARMRFLARRYRDFPLFRLPSQLLLGFAAQAPLLFVSALYDTGTAGQFALAMTAMSLPMTLIGRTMGQAYYGEAARMRDDAQGLWRMSFVVQARLFLFAIPFAALLILAAEPIFALVFGEEWRMAGHFTATLAVFLVLQVTSAPLMQALNILEQQRIFLVLNAARVAGLVAIYLVAKRGGWTVDSFVPVVAGFLSLFYGAQTLHVLALLWLRKTRES
ncbi:MAG: lipopolysaccharide biosynthesis protein [Anaerolineales bacterium]|nr:lipopolysaccharide biosynthesis protein [Anaerolineales bacterium]